MQKAPNVVSGPGRSRDDRHATSSASKLMFSMYLRASSVSARAISGLLAAAMPPTVLTSSALAALVAWAFSASLTSRCAWLTSFCA